MKTVKGLLLGSAAAFVAMSGAQAADLPMAAPVQYVKVCDTYGAGFFYIPGTQTCLQIAGFVNAQFRYDEPVARSSNAINFRARADVSLDARSQTPWGTLRGYVSIDSYFQNNNTSINQFFYGGAAGMIGPANPLGADPANGVYIANAYVQFAGLTAGYTLSNYDFPLAFAEMSFAPIEDLLPTLQVAYTASFGNGFSATIAIENSSYRNADFVPFGSPVVAVPAISALGGGGSSATRMPDIVGNLRVIQGWGAAQLSAAIHQVRAIGPGAGFDTNYGFAVQGALRINLPSLGAGDHFSIVGAFADGAMGYLGFGPTNSGELFNPLGSGYADAWVNPATGQLKNETGWQIVGTLQHHWTPNLRSNFTIAYDQDNAPTFVDPVGLKNLSDLSYLTAGANVIWTPVHDLDIGLEVVNQTAFKNAAQKAQAVGNGGFLNSKWTVISWITRRF
jgi:hypothetical protein